jgi:hypothetical protein
VEALSRRLIVNRSDYEAAKKIRETFVDRKMEKEVQIHWSWPKAMLDVGQCEAVQYTSDKWKKRGDYQDYKHVAEGPQHLYVRDGFLREYGSRRALEVESARVELPKKMPTAIAELAPILGFQFQPYIESDDPDDDLELSDTYFHVNIARAYIGAAQLPGSNEVFLIIYTKDDLCAIITGDILNVEKDGIVG